VRVEVADELEVLAEARAVHHVPRVAADGEHLSLLHRVVVVQRPLLRVLEDGALVDDSLPVVLAVWLQQPGQLEEAVGGADEANVRNLALELQVVDGDRGRLYEARVGEAHFLRESLEVVPVERPGDALWKNKLKYRMKIMNKLLVLC